MNDADTWNSGIWKFIASIYSQQSQAISAKQFAYVTSALHNLMNARWWRNEAIEVHVCKLSMDLEKLKFDKIMSTL